MVANHFMTYFCTLSTAELACASLMKKKLFLDTSGNKTKLEQCIFNTINIVLSNDVDLAYMGFKYTLAYIDNLTYRSCLIRCINNMSNFQNI